MALAKEHECLFFECSAKTQANVKQCFRELTAKVRFVESMESIHHSWPNVTNLNNFCFKVPTTSVTNYRCFSNCFDFTDTGGTEFAGERIYSRKESDSKAKTGT